MGLWAAGVSEPPVAAEAEEAAVVEGAFRPDFFLVSGNEFRLHGPVEEVAAFQEQRDFLEILLDPGIQDAVLFENGEEGGYLALVSHVTGKSPSTAEVGRSVGGQPPVVRLLDFPRLPMRAGGMVGFHAQVRCHNLSQPAQAQGTANDMAVRTVKPGKNFIGTVVDDLVEPGLLDLIALEGK